MNAFDWFQLLGLGAAAGAIGQSIRAIVGLKKTSDGAAPGTTLSDNIDPSRLVISLLIGAVAGVLAATTTLYNKLGTITPEMFFGLMAAGYAGSDFIEGFMNKVAPPNPGGANPAPVNASTNQPAANPAQAGDGAVG